MKDDPELQTDNDPSDERIGSTKRKRMESNGNRLLPALIVALLVVMLQGVLFYFLTTRPAKGDPALQSKMVSLEQKIAALEKQVGDLQAKPVTTAPDPSLLDRVDALSQKVEAFERQAQSTAESKAKRAPSKPAVTVQKQYHTVQKGETLYKISKEYGITVKELRRLNDLSEGQPVWTGQKLLISTER